MKTEKQNLNQQIKQVNKRMSIEEKNYQLLESIAKPVLTGEAYYMKFTAKHFMDFNVDFIYDNRIAMSHYYEQNGDMMADPDVEIVVDNVNRKLYPRTFQQDNMFVRYSIERHPEMKDSLNHFVNEWLTNVKIKGYTLAKVSGNGFELNEYENKEELVKFCEKYDININAGQNSQKDDKVRDEEPYL